MAKVLESASDLPPGWGEWMPKVWKIILSALEGLPSPKILTTKASEF